MLVDNGMREVAVETASDLTFDLIREFESAGGRWVFACTLRRRSDRSQYNGPADLHTSGRLVGQGECDRQAAQRFGCHFPSDPFK